MAISWPRPPAFSSTSASTVIRPLLVKFGLFWFIRVGKILDGAFPFYSHYPIFVIITHDDEELDGCFIRFVSTPTPSWWQSVLPTFAKLHLTVTGLNWTQVDITRLYWALIGSNWAASNLRRLNWALFGSAGAGFYFTDSNLVLAILGPTNRFNCAAINWL